MCAFGIFYELFFLIIKIIISVFLYLYLLVIKPFNFKILPVHALVCFQWCCAEDALHTKTKIVLLKLKWNHLIVKSVAKWLFVRITNK